MLGLVSNRPGFISAKFMFLSSCLLDRESVSVAIVYHVYHADNLTTPSMLHKL